MFSATFANQKIDAWVDKHYTDDIPTTRDCYSTSIEALYPIACHVRKALRELYVAEKITYKPIENMDENWWSLELLHKHTYHGIIQLNKHSVNLWKK